VKEETLTAGWRGVSPSSLFICIGIIILGFDRAGKKMKSPLSPLSEARMREMRAAAIGASVGANVREENNVVAKNNSYDLSNEMQDEMRRKGAQRRPARETGNLNVAFAKHRFEKDLTDLTEARTQFFAPHAHVSFFTCDPGYDVGRCPKIHTTIICEICPLNLMYRDVMWKFRIDLPQSFPFQAPIISAVSPLFHPNVDPLTGEVSLQLLKKDWSPVLTLRIVVLSLVLLFEEPNLEFAVNSEATFLLQTNWEMFQTKVEESKRSVKEQKNGQIFSETSRFRPKRNNFDSGLRVDSSSTVKRRFINNSNCNSSNTNKRTIMSKPADEAWENGSQSMLVQQLTDWSLSHSSKRMKLS